MISQSLTAAVIEDVQWWVRKKKSLKQSRFLFSTQHRWKFRAAGRATAAIRQRDGCVAGRYWR